jgi:hypothetical protein
MTFVIIDEPKTVIYKEKQMKHMRTGCIVLLLLAIGTIGYGKTYTYTITKDCGVDCMDASHRGGADATIKVLCHSLWLLGVELPGDLSSASQVQSATLTVNWDCIQQPRDTKVHQYNHPWSDNATTGSCWTYWLESYSWGGYEPRQSAGVLDQDRLEGTVGNGLGGDLNDGLIGAVSTYNVTQGVKNWLNGATNRGFAIWGVYNAVHNGVTEANTQTWERRFGFSAESAFPPVFTIEYTPSRPDYSSATGVWCFDEGSGTAVTDLSGNLHNGTLSGTNLSSCWSTNHPQGSDGYDYTGNDALAFDPTTSQHVTIPNSADLNPTEELTIQFWYKDGCAASTDSQFSYIAGQKDAWFIERYRADDTSDLRIKIYIEQEGFVGDWWNYGITQLMYIPQDGNWHHIAFTYSNSNSICKCYLDGALKGSTSYSSPLATSTSDLWIGSLEASPARRHTFSVDEFMMFAAARSDIQISSSYQLSLHSTTSVPTFNPAGPEIRGDTEVTITAATGATIYYTTNGDTPTTSGTAYTSPTSVTVSNGMTLKAIAVVGNVSSWVTAQAYSYPQVAAPTFSPGGRYISGETKVVISSKTEGATIYYTTDGLTPTAGSDSHSSPATVTVSNGMTVQAMAMLTGYNASEVTSMTFAVPAVYNGPQTISYGSATIDGDLSDWSNVTWATLGVVADIGTSEADVLADVPLAYYAAKWQANKIYVAVKVQDKSRYFTDSYIAWNVHDSIEVYVHTDNDGLTDYSSYNTLAQQYEFGFKTDAENMWAYVGANGAYDLSSSSAVAQAAGQVTQDGWLYYEMAITPYTYFSLLKDGSMTNSVVSNLFSGQVVGLDVAVLCNNSKGTYLGKKLENDMTSKYNNWENIGKHVLARMSGDANGDGMVDVGDLGILAANYGGSNKTWAEGDFNGDGKVDVGDLGILAANYGSSGSGFEADYAKVFGTDDSEDDTESISTLCSSLGLSLIAGLALMGMMLIKLDE